MARKTPASGNSAPSPLPQVTRGGDSSACQTRIPTRLCRALHRPGIHLPCPVTAQPDFAHLVIDYAPREWLVEFEVAQALSRELP